MKRPQNYQEASTLKLKHPAIYSSPRLQFVIFAIAGAIILIALYEALYGVGRLFSLSRAVGVLIYATAACLAYVRLHKDYPHASLGLCNVVTLARLVLVGVLIVALIERIQPGWITFAIATTALCLDGVDGWLARKQALSSRFGARFDVEVDALFALVLAIFAASSGSAGPAVILLGIPHYLFWIARTVLPWLNHDLPGRQSRKIVCVVQIAALIVIQIPPLANGRLDFLIGLVAIALIWSFSRDIIWLRQNYS